jgi:hypothetical protein
MSLLLGKTLGPDAAATMAELAAPDEEEGGYEEDSGSFDCSFGAGTRPSMASDPTSPKVKA